MALQITSMLCPENKYNIKCPYDMNPTRIVVHNTANDASAMAEISYMIGNNKETSFHYAVDDTRAVQGLPLNKNGWHAGDGNGKGNREGIAIEICYSKSGGDRFTAAENNAVDLIVALLKQFNWGIDNVTKHQDYSGKYCPHRTLDLGWVRFLNEIKIKLAVINTVTTNTSSAPSTSKTTATTQGAVNTSGFVAGDKVKVLNPVTYGANQKFTLYHDVYNVIGTPVGDRVVIGVGMAVTAPIKSSNIAKINSVPTAPQSKPVAIPLQVVETTYMVRTKNHGWLSAVKGLSDFAGISNDPITAIAIKVSAGSVKYSVHVKDGGWLPSVTGFNIKDNDSGYAGNGTEIDGLKVYYNTPSNIRPFKQAKYHVWTVGASNYYAWQYDEDTNNNQDGYAGDFGKSISKIQITIE